MSRTSIAKRGEARLLNLLPQGVQLTPELQAIAKEAGKRLEALTSKDKQTSVAPDAFIAELNWFVKGTSISVSFPLTRYTLRHNVYAHLLDRATAGAPHLPQAVLNRFKQVVKGECQKMALLFAEEVFRYFGNPKYLASVVGEAIFVGFLDRFKEFKAGGKPMELLDFTLVDGHPLLPETARAS